MRLDQDAVSLVVDAINDVLDIDDAAIVSTPDTVEAAIRPMLAGVVPLPKELLLILDVRSSLSLAA